MMSSAVLVEYNIRMTRRFLCALSLRQMVATKSVYAQIAALISVIVIINIRRAIVDLYLLVKYIVNAFLIIRYMFRCAIRR